MEYLSKVSEAQASEALFGIRHYQPAVLLTTDEIILECRRILHQTLGEPLTASWAGWNDKDNSWCESLPIILEIGGIRYEICWRKEAECGLSQDLINTQESFYCYGSKELPGVWKENALPEIQRVLGQVLLGMELIEAKVTISSEGFINKYWVPHGLLFKFGQEALYLYNGFDLNAVAEKPLGGAGFRSVKISL